MQETRGVPSMLVASVARFVSCIVHLSEMLNGVTFYDMIEWTLQLNSHGVRLSLSKDKYALWLVFSKSYSIQQTLGKDSPLNIKAYKSKIGHALSFIYLKWVCS